MMKVNLEVLVLIQGSYAREHTNMIVPFSLAFSAVTAAWEMLCITAPSVLFPSTVSIFDVKSCFGNMLKGISTAVAAGGSWGH